MKRYNNYTPRDLWKIWAEYHKSDKTERFGQYVYNRWEQNRVQCGFYCLPESWPELFYEEDNVIAYDLLAEHVGD